MAENQPPYKTWRKSRSLRLKDFDYSSPWFAYHIIIGTGENRDVFSDPAINREIIKTLKTSAKLYGYQLLSYCLMPDHVHILVQATESPKDLRRFIRGFKSFSTKSVGKNLWQRSFYEHILRREENLVDVARYILNNPVRKGLVEEYKQYKW